MKKIRTNLSGNYFIPGRKYLRIMKLTFIFMLLGLFTYATKTYSQSTKLTFESNDATIERVFKEIEARSEFKFAYNSSKLNVDQKISVKADHETIDVVLDKILGSTDFRYKIVDRYIIINDENGNNPSTVGADQSSRTVKGKVTDASGATLPGVSVVVKGTTSGVITDNDGSYSLSNVPGNAVLQFTFVGMKGQEIAVDGKTTINVAMADETFGVEEVIVVGYGTQKKVNMTGAVSSVKFEEMASSRPITTVSSALSGLSSGVTVRQSTGKPGSDGATILVRGLGTLNNASPLVIIDGMEGSLDALNPQDIESVSVLKDAASASIYGSRAANGVILVTTKKGENKKLTVTYNGTFSVAQPANLLDFVSDYPTYMKLMNESARNISSAEVFGATTIAAWETAQKDPNALNSLGVPNYISFPNTNWNKEMYHKNLIKDNTVSISGATQNARFLLSAGYLDNPGLVDNTGMQRYSIRTNVEIDANKWLTVGTRTYATMNDTQMGNYSNVLTYAYQTTPGVYPAHNGLWGYPEAPEESATANNLYVMLNGLKGKDKVTRINSTLYSRVKLLKGLSWDFNLNYNKRFDEYNSIGNPAVGRRVKFSNNQVMSPVTDPSLLSTYYNTYSSYTRVLENLLRYQTTLAEKHGIAALLGYNETYAYSYNHNATKKGLFDESAYVFDAATTMISTTGTSSDWAMRSWFGRLNYDFDQRYLFEANLRYDGSSRFSTDNRHGVFPSFSAGWRISEEGFMKSLNIFQNLKLRGSWGKLGNNASGNYDYMALYNPVGYSFNGIQVTGLASTKIPNPLLQWESTTVTNLGLDASLLGGRLTAEVDAYNKVTDGILTTPPIYLTLGLVGAPTLNTAEVTNKGIEITMGWKDKVGAVHYSVSGNFGFNKNTVTGYKGQLIEEWRTDAAGAPVYYSNLGDVSSGGQNRILEGHMINEHYLMDVYKGDANYFKADGTVNITGGPKDGMIRTSKDMDWLNAMIGAGYKFMPNLTTARNKIWYGDYIYADMNNDKIYGNSYDRRFTGNSTMPKMTFGSQMNVRWKNFDLNLIWSGQAGCKLYWLERGYNSSTTRTGFQIGAMIADDHYYYNDANTADPLNNVTATYPRLKLNESDSQNTQASTHWLYDGSFVRLKNLTLGYTLPRAIASKIFTDQVRLYFSAENLFTITSFPGLDPEMGGNTNYPVFRQIAFGTNITF
jgi:TonB-linked SusC/RagA family outer membrane protein